MKKLIILLVIIVLGLAFLGGGSPEGVASKSVTVPLSTLNGSNQAGEAVLTEVDGQVQVAINLEGAPAGIPQPAHIHIGSCDTIGDPVYSLSAVEDGTSKTTLTASLGALKLGGPLAIDVRKSVADIGTDVACGEIVVE